MNNETINIIERLPTSAEYNALRQAVGWHSLPAERAAAALDKSLFAVCAVDHHAVIGFGRIVGDGAVYFYIQDVMVAPAYQRLGIGRGILQHLMATLETLAPPHSGAFIGLMTAPELTDFYALHGFIPLAEGGQFLHKWRNGH